MPTFNDYGIILSHKRLQESDRVFNIYTREKGLVRAVGKSGKKQSNKFYGKLDQLSCCNFQFAKGKNLYTICEYEQINSFPQLRSDLSKLTNAVLILEIVNGFAHEDEIDSQHTYDLLYSSLDNLQESSNPDLNSINFISEFLSLHGYKPQLDTCVHCSETVGADLVSALVDSYPYSSILGGILCSKCAEVIEHKQIEPDVINLLKSKIKSQNQGNIRLALDLLREHIDIRAKNKINSFDLVMSL